MKKLSIVIVLLMMGCAFLMAQKTEQAPVELTFEDVTKSVGLEMPNGQGRRIAWGDYDNDGWEDLLLNGTTLFKNNKGKFINVTQKVKMSGGSGGGIWGDYDNDGLLDILSYNHSKYTLWHNNKDGTFTDVTKKAGLENNPNRTEAVAWLDFNNDGFLDFYVANYEVNDKDQMSVGTPDVLWLNNKDGTFTDITGKSGVSESEKPKCGYGVAPADFNNDGLMDIYVTNYRLQPNYLYQNKGPTEDGTYTFSDVSREKGVQGKETPLNDNGGIFLSYGHSIGACWGDIDNDGDLDVFCASLAHPGRFLEFSDTARLFINRGAPGWNFKDIREQSGIPYVETHSEPAFGDYNKDGFLDLYLSCCYANVKSYFYRNQGDLTFKDVTAETAISQTDGWGSGWCDYDNDGNLDIATGGGWTSSVKLFRNTGNKLPYLKVKVVGKHCNRSGIGARIKVTAGELVQIREIAGARGTGSQDSLIAFFGLANHKGAVDVEVRFPCGKTKTIKSQSTNKMITVSE